MLGVTLLLFVLTNLVVARRTPEAQSAWLRLSPDTYEYEALVRGGRAGAPFAFRRLVPLLASLLPLPPFQALGAITQASLLSGYAVLGWTLVGILRIRVAASCLAVAALMTSTRSLLMFQNPYIIDGFSFLMMALMMAAFLANKPGRFGVVAFTGILAREDSLFSAMGFIARPGRRRVGLAIVIVAIGAYAIPRWGQGGVVAAFLGFRPLFHAPYYAKSYFAFGFLWPAFLLGLWLMPAPHRGHIFPYFAATFVGCVVSTLFAVDTTRMFLPLLPVALVGCAVLFDKLIGHLSFSLAWSVLVLADLGVGLPTTFFPDVVNSMTELEDWYVRFALPIVLLQVAGIVLTVLSARLIFRGDIGSTRRKGPIPADS